MLPQVSLDSQVHPKKYVLQKKNMTSVTSKEEDK